MYSRVGIRMARAYANNYSDDPDTKVGCYMELTGEFSVLASNILISGVDRAPDTVSKKGKKIWMRHAEEVAVCRWFRMLREHGHSSHYGPFAYLTHKPCLRCARLLLSVEPRAIYIGEGHTTEGENDWSSVMSLFVGTRTPFELVGE